MRYSAHAESRSVLRLSVELVVLLRRRSRRVSLSVGLTLSLADSLRGLSWSCFLFALFLGCRFFFLRSSSMLPQCHVRPMAHMPMAHIGSCKHAAASTVASVPRQIITAQAIARGGSTTPDWLRGSISIRLANVSGRAVPWALRRIWLQKAPEKLAQRCRVPRRIHVAHELVDHRRLRTDLHTTDAVRHAPGARARTRIDDNAPTKPTASHNRTGMHTI